MYMCFFQVGPNFNLPSQSYDELFDSSAHLFNSLGTSGGVFIWLQDVSDTKCDLQHFVLLYFFQFLLHTFSLLFFFSSLGPQTYIFLSILVFLRAAFLIILFRIDFLSYIPTDTRDKTIQYNKLRKIKSYLLSETSFIDAFLAAEFTL